MDKKKINVLIISPFSSSFVKTDLELLSKYFNTRFILWKGNISFIPKSIFELVMDILWADVTFSWFADIHAYYAVMFSKILRKKSIVIASGYSVANMPEINYGLMNSSKMHNLAKYVLENADKILAVSEFNKSEILKYIKNVECVYHGIDYSNYLPKNPKENLVISVGNVNFSNLKRKGLITFVKSAAYLPDIEFILIGSYVDKSIYHLKSIATPNVKFSGYVSDDKLLEYYQRAKVYVQISAHESFGMSLAEAMSCECTPVVTNRGAIPEVVGDTGFYVPYGDAKKTAEAIGKALDSNKGREAREWIKKMFPMEKREKELVDVINQLYNK